MKTLALSALFAFAAFLGAQAADAPSPVAADAAPDSPTPTTPQETPAIVNPSVLIATSLGNITLELDAVKAPVTVANFLAYVDDKFYDGTIFHRVIDGFMIQGGGFTPNMQQKQTRGMIKNEAANGLKNDRGTIAMARTMVVDSATAQFFINHRDNASLNHRGTAPEGFGYAVFGKVTDGMEVVDKIALVRTGNAGGYQNVPVETVTITRISRIPAAVAE